MARLLTNAFFIAQSLLPSFAISLRQNRNLVIGGDEAQQARHPYMISLQNGGSHYCGGSLIARDIVLTAGKYSRSVSVSS